MYVNTVHDAADDARRAAEEGRTVMVYEHVREGEFIEAIEAQGWRLEHIIPHSISERAMVTVFRRR